jgi:hypothetical protein
MFLLRIFVVVLISTVVSLPWFFTFAQGPLDPFEDEDEVPGVGSLLYKLKVPGEPVSAPAEFEISVICHGETVSRVIARVRMCQFLGYETERQVKILTLTFKQGMVDRGGRVGCDLVQERTFRFAHLCKRKK